MCTYMLIITVSCDITHIANMNMQLDHWTYNMNTQLDHQTYSMEI